MRNSAIGTAVAVAASVIKEAEASGEAVSRMSAALVMLEVHLRRGELDAAESLSNALDDAVMMVPYHSLWYLGLLAEIRLAQGRAREALETTDQAIGMISASGLQHYAGHAGLLLTRAQIFDAMEDRAAACSAIRIARDDLLARAAGIADPEARRSFLECITTHARTIALAKDWIGE